MVRRAWIDALLIAGLLFVLAFFASRAAVSLPYGYDEADYVYAAGRGLRANYLDAGSIPIGEFVRLGLGRGRDPAEKRSLSEFIRDRGDVLFYRHWHGPLYYYWLAAVAAHWKFDERAMHEWMLVFAAATILLLYFGVRWAIAGKAGRTAALLAAAVYASGYVNIRTGAMIGPHSLFVLLTLALTILLMRLMAAGAQAPANAAIGETAAGQSGTGLLACRSLFPQSAGLRCWYAALVLTGLAAATLEVAFVAAGTLVVVAWLERRRTFAGFGAREWLRFGVRSAAVIVTVLLLVWPAALLRLSVVKAYAFMVYLSIFR
ncbi:MAG: hypothetical protein ABSG25_02050, partial [Bryobacteraceae bacterium]